MADLIDRAALLEQLESFRADEKWRKKRTLCERWLRTIGIDIFAEAVKKFPAVDAVEVVRCSKCELHDSCYAEDVFKTARMDLEKAFCCLGLERKTDATD